MQSLYLTSRRFLSSTRQTGTIKFYYRKKAYGFITPDNGMADIFVHRSGISSSKTEDLMHPFLRKGERVSYEMEERPTETRAPQATEVRWVNGNEIPPLRPSFYVHELEKVYHMLGEAVWKCMQQKDMPSQLPQTMQESVSAAEAHMDQVHTLIERVGMRVEDFPTEIKKRTKSSQQNEGDEEGED